MEQILNKLSEIEATANAIMQDAARQKQALSEEAEKQTKEFDASLEKETSDEIQKIREDLAREKDARINELRAETENQLSSWTPITKPITKVFAVSCFRK